MDDRKFTVSDILENMLDSAGYDDKEPVYGNMSDISFEGDGHTLRFRVDPIVNRDGAVVSGFEVWEDGKSIFDSRDYMDKSTDYIYSHVQPIFDDLVDRYEGVEFEQTSTEISHSNIPRTLLNKLVDIYDRVAEEFNNGFVNKDKSMAIDMRAMANEYTKSDDYSL